MNLLVTSIGVGILATFLIIFAFTWEQMNLLGAAVGFVVMGWGLLAKDDRLLKPKVK